MLKLLRQDLVRACRSDAGFGMVELVAAMAVMSVGVLALFGMFQSGLVQIRRASTVTTAAALADTEMEQFRAVKYNTIGLVSSAVSGSDSTYKADSAYRAVSTPENQLDSAVTVAACPATPCTTSVPTKSVTGADGKSYRVDTYVTWQRYSSGGTTGRWHKLVTIVVRQSSNSQVFARVASAFDESTGS